MLGILGWVGFVDGGLSYVRLRWVVLACVRLGGLGLRCLKLRRVVLRYVALICVRLC